LFPKRLAQLSTLPDYVAFNGRPSQYVKDPGSLGEELWLHAGRSGASGESDASEHPFV
jgi:hypothetical protein